MGTVLSAEILQNLDVIVKLSKVMSVYDINDMKREYFVGATEINKLRYIIPNFCYTLGAFTCPGDGKNLCGPSNYPNSIFIIYEKIEGVTMHEYYNSTIESERFEKFLCIFAQLLLALEVAQREIGLTHFDLHTGNVMITNNTTPYNVYLDNIDFTVSPGGIMPVIIDYGYTCVIHNNHYIGENDTGDNGAINPFLYKSGITPFCIPAFDMYKFLGSISGDKDVLKLFKFFEKDDPYDIYKQPSDLYFAQKDFFRMVSFYPSASYTPLNFLQWLLSIPEYAKILNKTINLSARYTWNPIITPKAEIIYKNIMQDGIPINFDDMSIDKIPRLYCLLHYIMKTNLNPSVVANIQRIVNEHSHILIKSDILLLDKYKYLNIMPDVSLFNSISDTLYAMQLGTPDSEKTKIIKKVNDVVYAYRQFLSYMNYIYMIFQFRLENNYSDFLQEFLKSKQYSDYITYVQKFESLIRYSKTIQASLTYFRVPDKSVKSVK
jgi:hypothetical protein